MKTKHSKAANKKADAVITELNHIERWRLVHDLLGKQNKLARKEQKAHAKAMADVRKEKIYNKRKAKKGQLRFGVSIPNMTYQAIVDADMLIFGESMLFDPKKDEHSTPNATNKIVRDLAKAFPEYKAS